MGMLLLTAAAAATFATAPLHFEPNVGQTPPDVRYVARGGTSEFRFIDAGAEISTVRLRMQDGRDDVRVTADQPLPGRSNYLRGSDASQWHRNVPHYARLRYEGIYPGIDVIYY